MILIIAQFLNHFISTVAIESSIFFMGGESGSTGFLHPTNNAIPEPTKPKNWWNKIEFFHETILWIGLNIFRLLKTMFSKYYLPIA